MPFLPLGTRIRRARIQRNLTQKKLASLTQVTQASISNYERGVMVPTDETLTALAKALGLPTTELQLDEGYAEAPRGMTSPLKASQQRLLQTFRELPGTAIWERAAGEVGGDLAFVHTLRNQQYVVLIDGSGSGVEAATSSVALSAFVWGVMQSAGGIVWPAEILEQTERLPGPLGGPQQGAVLVMLFDKTHRTLYHARSLGIPPPYLRNGRRTSFLQGRQSRLGRFQEGEVKNLGTGSLLLLATDGVANAARASGKPLWHSPDIKKWVTRSRSADELLERVTERATRGRPLGSDDDMFVAAIEL